MGTYCCRSSESVCRKSICTIPADSHWLVVGCSMPAIVTTQQGWVKSAYTSILDSQAHNEAELFEPVNRCMQSVLRIRVDDMERICIQNKFTATDWIIRSLNDYVLIDESR